MRHLGTLMVTLIIAALVAMGCSGTDEDDQGTDTVAQDTESPGEDTADTSSSVDTDEPQIDTAAPDTVEEIADPGDTEPPEVTFDLQPYAALTGLMTLPAEWSDNEMVQSVEVLIDGESVTWVPTIEKTLDTSTLPAGLHDMALMVTDSSGNSTTTDAIPVVIAGEGQFLPFVDGWSEGAILGWGGFDLVIPEDATEVYDQKAHVTIAGTVSEVRAFVVWDAKSGDGKEQASWNIGLDVGLGGCPHSGTLLAYDDLEGTTGLIEVDYAEEGAALTTGTWFAHLRFTDGMEHLGETIHFDLLFLTLP